ncbi:MAG TPA: AAA family ATPase [Stellaceae bacterium]|nr:AAA family ATPase [Stellaceae bacterium]
MGELIMQDIEAWKSPFPNGGDRFDGSGFRERRTATTHAARLVDGRPADLPPLDFLDIGRWIDREPPAAEWLAEGLIPKRQVTLLTGDGGLGKSMLLLQLLAAASRGKQWLGRSVMPCRSVALFCEDEEAEIWRRMLPICRFYGCEIADLVEDVHIRAEVEDDNFLVEAKRWDPLEPTALLTRLERAIHEIRPGIVGLDSAYDVFGGDDVDNRHARDFVKLLRSIAVNHDCAVVLNSHPSKASMNSGAGYAGSVAWHNKVRRRLWLTRPASKVDDDEAPDDNRRVLKGMKNNSGPSGGDIELEWRDGVFQVIGQSAAPRSQFDKLSTEAKFIELMHKIIQEGTKVSAKERASNYAPRVFAKHPRGKNFSRGDFAAAMRSLLDKGRIKTDTQGPASRQYEYLIVVNGTQNAGAE